MCVRDCASGEAQQGGRWGVFYDRKLLPHGKKLVFFRLSKSSEASQESSEASRDSSEEWKRKEKKRTLFFVVIRANSIFSPLSFFFSTGEIELFAFRFAFASPALSLSLSFSLCFSGMKTSLATMRSSSSSSSSGSLAGSRRAAADGVLLGQHAPVFCRRPLALARQPLRKKIVVSALGQVRFVRALFLPHSHAKRSLLSRSCPPDQVGKVTLASSRH